MQEILRGKTRSSEAKQKLEWAQNQMKSTKKHVREVNDEFVGDGLLVKLFSNENIISVRGDGCRVYIRINNGLLRITGDGCCININLNLGFVEYNGDGGHIVLGPKSLRERVKYTGDGGSINYDKLLEWKDEDDLDTMKTERRKSKRKARKILVTMSRMSIKDDSGKMKINRDNCDKND